MTASGLLAAHTGMYRSQISMEDGLRKKTQEDEPRPSHRKRRPSEEVDGKETNSSDEFRPVLNAVQMLVCNSTSYLLLIVHT